MDIEREGNAQEKGLSSSESNEQVKSCATRIRFVLVHSLSLFYFFYSVTCLLFSFFPFGMTAYVSTAADGRDAVRRLKSP